MEPRRHPDLFTAAEACEYLHLPTDATRTLETLREKQLLQGHYVGKEFMYHREDLDACITSIFHKGPRQVGTGPRIKLSGRAAV